MTSIFHRLLTGPNALIGATGAVLTYLYFAEKQKLHTERPRLYDALNNLCSSDPEERTQAIKDLISELQQKYGSKEETEDTKDIVFDNGALRALHNIIAKADADDAPAVHEALKAILYILDGGVDKRIHFINIGGLFTVAKIVLQTEQFPLAYTPTSNIRELAGMVLRKASKFDVQKREIPEDVPAGSEGGELIAKQLSEDQWETLVDILQQNNASPNLKSIVGLIAHISQTYNGTQLLAKHDIGALLIRWLRATDEDTQKKELRHNVVVALGNIAQHAYASIQDTITRPDIMESVLTAIPPRGGSPKVLHSAISILSAASVALKQEEDHESREKIAVVMLKNKERTRAIFESSEAKTPGVADKVHIIERLFSSKKLLPESYESIRALQRQVKDAQVQRKKEQQDKQRQQQEMMMMGGMGGMMGGMGGMGGMPAPTAEELMMMRQMGLI